MPLLCKVALLTGQIKKNRCQNCAWATAFTAALNGAPVPLRRLHGRVEERILAERPPPNLPHHPELFLHPHGEGEPRVRLGTALVTPHTPRHRRR